MSTLPLTDTITDMSSLACNGTIVHDDEMGEVIQLQGDQRKHMQEFLVDKEDGLELDPKTIKVCISTWPRGLACDTSADIPSLTAGPRLLRASSWSCPSYPCLDHETLRRYIGEATWCLPDRHKPRRGHIQHGDGT